MPTYTVTVKRVIKLVQTYTIEAASEREARADARELACDTDAATYGGEWRVTDVDTVAETDPV